MDAEFVGIPASAMRPVGHVVFDVEPESLLPGEGFAEMVAATATAGINATAH